MFIKKKSLAQGQVHTEFSLAGLEKLLAPGIGQWDLSAPGTFACQTVILSPSVSVGVSRFGLFQVRPLVFSASSFFFGLLLFRPKVPSRFG
jgi:hypothetical protein